jgi:hypothetical protein
MKAPLAQLSPVFCLLSKEKYVVTEDCGGGQLLLTQDPQDGAGDSQQGHRKHTWQQLFLARTCFWKYK